MTDLWISDSPHKTFVLSTEKVVGIAGAITAIDGLYAAGRTAEAERLDAAVEQLMEELEAEGTELDTESSDVYESGIEDYEVDETKDEGFISDPSDLEDYWWPFMLVASDDPR